MLPRVISHYRIIRRLGAGGMGEVFLAQDIQLDRPVALKVMSAELAKDPNQRKRFRAEARAASGLTHPHICVIYDVGETKDGRPFLAMEYVEGQTLDLILHERRLNMREILNLGIGAAEALAAAHLHGLVHRDIKPANLMLNRQGHVKVMDFGLAKRCAPDTLSAMAISTPAHTRTGMLIGTPQYMSPEQALGHPLDARSDIFSLGAVLYELVVGQRPFLGQTVGESINAIVNQRAAPLSLQNPAFSPALDTIIFKCLEKEPGKRYASAQELAADLRKLKEDAKDVLAAMRQEETPAPVTSISRGRPTALWKLAAKVSASRHAAGLWVIGFVVVALLVLASWALLQGGGLKSTPPGGKATAAAPRKSVAVLPFVNLSPDKNDEYLSDGMTEEVLNALAKNKVLRVPARTSCFVFKGKTDNIRKIGEQLNVVTVLEGSVRKAGNQLRITAQLINVADDSHLWSETYDRDMTNIFAIQSDIASRVAEALKVQLLGAGSEPTKSTEAYKLFLQGRYFWNRRTEADIQQAIKYFRQATSKDPGYALAYAGLANCYNILSAFTAQPGRANDAKARAAALKALELDSSLAEPRATLAHIRAFSDWDWKGAAEEFERAIALNPNHATAHQWLAGVFRALGRYDKCLAEMRQAQELDPLSPIIQTSLSIALFQTGEEDLAIELLEKQTALDPSFVHAHFVLGFLYLEKGRFPESLAEFKTMRKLDRSGVFGLVGFGVASARSGMTNEAQRIIGQMQERQRQGFEYRLDIAAIQHALGNNEAALALLEEAFAERVYGLEQLNCGTYWKDLRPHPRAQAILRKMNLVD